MLSLPPQIFIPRFPPVFSSALRVLSCTRLRFNWTDPPRIPQSQPCFAMHPTETILAKLVVADVFSYRLGGTREKTDPTFLTFAQIYLTVLASFSVPSFARAKRPKFGETSKYFAGNNVWRNITFEERKRFLFSISFTRYPSAERGIGGYGRNERSNDPLRASFGG